MRATLRLAAVGKKKKRLVETHAPKQEEEWGGWQKGKRGLHQQKNKDMGGSIRENEREY